MRKCCLSVLRLTPVSLMVSPIVTRPCSRANLKSNLWFVTLHSFGDGNGRIARAIGDLLLARADGSPQRFYSLSAQIQRERRAYYAILERTQKGALDVTPWLSWFLQNLAIAVNTAQHTLDAVLVKTRFWQRWATTPLNARQVKLLNHLLDGFDGKLNSSKTPRRSLAFDHSNGCSSKNMWPTRCRARSC